MTTFQKITFFLTLDQLIQVLLEPGPMNGLVLDLSVKDDFVTVIDVRKGIYHPKDKITPKGKGQSAIPTPPGGHREDDEIDLKIPENEHSSQLFESKIKYTEPRTFENIL